MSKKIFIVSIILAVSIAVGLIVHSQVQQNTSNPKGQVVLDELLDVEFEYVGKGDTWESTIVFTTFTEPRNVDSHKFVDEHGAFYYTNLYDGQLIKYYDKHNVETDIKDEETAGLAAVDFAKKLFPDFFNYDYAYMTDPYFGDAAIIIRQLNKDGLFTGNYIDSEIHNDTKVVEMAVNHNFDPEAKLLSQEAVIEIAYERTVYFTDCIQKKLSSQRVPYLQNRLLENSADENILQFISIMAEHEDINLQNYTTNIDDREHLKITANSRIALRDEFWWRVYIEDVEDNYGSLDSGANNTFTFVYYIEPRTGQILQSNIHMP